MGTQTLIDELQATIQRQLARCVEFRQLPIALLRQRPDPKRWSVLEVIEHMNLSGRVYFRGLQKVFADQRSSLRYAAEFQPGRWGDLFTKGLQPGSNGKISWKMRTMGMFEPRTAHTKGLASLDEFETMLRGSMELLDQARSRGLDGAKVTSTLGPILRFKVGDAFRFPLAHQERHMLQIERTLAALSAEVGSDLN